MFNKATSPEVKKSLNALRGKLIDISVSFQTNIAFLPSYLTLLILFNYLCMSIYIIYF